MIVGTKLDLTNEREVSVQKLQDLSAQWGGVSIYETSAKRNWNVQDVFADLVRQMRERIPPETRKGRRRDRLKGLCVVM